MAIDELTPEQIRVPEIYQKIKKLADSFVLYIQAKQAYFLQEKLTSVLNLSDLQTFNPELYKNYQDLLIPLKWTAFSLLSEEDALMLLKNGYIAVLDNELIDVQDNIVARMFTLGIFPRNELRQKMHKALNENKEYLGNKTFGEWLLDYSKTFDFRERDEMTPMKYVNQNPEARSLAEAERNKLRKALQIFDKSLFATPIMSEPLFSMSVMAMIKNKLIDKNSINPLLLQTIAITANAASQAPVPPPPVKKEEIKKEIKPTPLAFEEKIEKPGLFKRLFKKKEESEITEKPEITELPKEKTEEILEKYEKIISPYEKKRELFSTEKIKPEFEEKEIQEIKEIKPETPLPKPQYHIRTMKTDIEKAKKEPMTGSRQAIPPASPASSTEGKKPIPKARDHIVDLSDK